jgi:hypothetical protein
MKLKYLVTLFTSIALLTPLGAQAFAVPTCGPTICDITITGGSYQVYKETTQGILDPVNPSTYTDVKDILMDNSVRGNVELGSFLAPNDQTTMTVTFADGSTATFSNPLEIDWRANSEALARNYITAAGNSVGITLSSGELDTATDYFLNRPTALGIAAWRLASDPNIATINLVDGQIKVGLDGLLNASNFLNILFAGQAIAPINAQASEVVKVTFNGNSQYRYGFSATPTGYATADGSYNGQYQVPEPTTLLLLGFGFIGLGYMHRHNKREQAIVA